MAPAIFPKRFSMFFVFLTFFAFWLRFGTTFGEGDRFFSSLAHSFAPKHCFCRAKWSSESWTSEVCSFIVKIVCEVWKSLKTPSNIAFLVFGKAFLSFSLRFCSTFKKHCKSRLKIEILAFRSDTLHTCSHEKLNFEVQLWKNDCGANTCAKCDRGFAFYCGFIVCSFSGLSFFSAFTENVAKS